MEFQSSTSMEGILLAAATLPQAVPVAEATKPLFPMILIGAVLAATFVFIAFNWLHKTIAALSGAIVAVTLALMLGIFSGERPYGAVHDFIHHDLGVIGVIVGTSIIVTIAGDSGLFHFLAVRLVKLTGGKPSLLLPALMAVTVGFVTLLTIAPGALIMVSLVLVITRALGDDPRPYVMAVAIAANSGALMTFASGIPTLMIGASARIPYMHYFVVSMPLAILSAIVAFFVLKVMHRRTLVFEGSAEERAAKIASFDEWALVKDRTFFYRSAAIIVFTFLGFAVAQKLKVGLDFIAIIGATAALLFSGHPPEETIKKVKWSIIIFFVGLFVLIGTVGETGLLELLAAKIYGISGNDMTLALFLLIPFVFFMAGLVGNIPMAATMIPIVQTMVEKGLAAEPLWWSLIAACNLGGNPTPVGSIGAVIALHALERERGITIGWGEYLKVGGAVTVLQIALVLVYMNLFRISELFPSLGRCSSEARSKCMDELQVNEKDLRENIGAFEAALTSKPVDLSLPDIDRILLAIDGSNQDEAVLEITSTLGKQTAADVMVLYGYEGPADEVKEAYLNRRAAELKASGIRADAVERSSSMKHTKRSFEQILDARERHQSQIIVVCAPYMEDFSKLGKESAGTNLNMLMSRSPVPLLVVREPGASSAASLRKLLLPVSPYTSETPEAAGWALRLLEGEGGMLLIVGVVDRKQLEAAGALLSVDISIHELDDNALAGLHLPEVAGLIANLQKRAADAGFTCRVLVRSGSEVETVAELANEEGYTLVLPCPCERESASYLRTQALVRASLKPVLVV